MSRAHLKSLRGLISYNPGLSLGEANRVVFDTRHDENKILAAIDAVPSKEGTILVVTNFTGDCLHFGLANEKAIARGHRCRMMVCGDDVSIGKTNGSLVGRRGLAGQIASIAATRDGEIVGPGTSL
ncbi:dihydroxyacetone kinase [Diaporthe helianthi]|uniref:Dihydroxyacetone kinase n=1 Tax=Diaporthe helianthi TaxID=158607 RepID=A0A2P5HFL9_DIAHE|nr:dihydroxyacetone kinase [Diaporthe helianthi]